MSIESVKKHHPHRNTSFCLLIAIDKEGSQRSSVLERFACALTRVRKPTSEARYTEQTGNGGETCGMRVEVSCLDESDAAKEKQLDNNNSPL